eukprot:m51a1_g7829 hypothetical protein (191) ;mRNA; f:161620-162290
MHVLGLAALLMGPALCLSTGSTCLYAFVSPREPTLLWTPTTVPDTSISANNSIHLSDGTPLNHGEVCNGFRAEYRNDTDPGAEDFSGNGTWTSRYVGCDGVVRESFDTFYANGDQVFARAVQVWQRTLFDVLEGRTVRLWIDCNNGVQSCLLFRIVPSAAPYHTCPSGALSSAPSAAALLLAVLAVVMHG